MRDQSEIGGRPLSGLRVAVTRPAAQAGGLLAGLSELGAEPLHHPTIRIEDPTDPIPFRRAVARLESYEWIVFTSANGVARFWHAWAEISGARELPAGVHIAAIGPATAAALTRRGVRAEVVPQEYVAEAVADALTGSEGLAGCRVLLPRAAGARQVLPERLRAAGAEVDEVVAYESHADLEGIAALRAGLERGLIDVVTFTAASTVRAFVEVAGPDLGRARVVAIGPITADAARAAGVRVDAVAREYTTEGLLEAIVELHKNRKESQ